MTHTDLHTLASSLFEGQDLLRGPLPPDLCAPGYVAQIVGFPPMDQNAHAEFGKAFYAGSPDIFHTIDETLVAGGRVTVRFTLRGAHTGSFMGIPFRAAR